MDSPRPAGGLPQTIGRYQILGRIGRGSMGVVYSAHDTVMDRAVAIKVMMADLEDDPEGSVRFYREARSAGQLAHRNIITVFDMGEDDGRPYIVMELLAGHTLGNYLKRPDPLPLEQKLDLMVQVCEGLQVAHDHGIFHRDIKPGNLWVRPDASVKILDFGIARLASSSMTASGLIVGTPDYMSPEQARGHDIDHRSDIFSAGAVFYLMLTGRKPFAASDLPGVFAKVNNEDPLPIRDTEGTPAVAQFVMKALAKSPAARYQHCSEMVADLNRIRRDLDRDTARVLDASQQQLEAIELLATERLTYCGQLSVAAPLDDNARIREFLRDQFPAAGEWLDGAHSTNPLGHAITSELVGALDRAHRALTADVDRLRRAATALVAGKRAGQTGDLRSALQHFTAVLDAVPECETASVESQRIRSRMAQEQSTTDRISAVVAEARMAAARGEWPTVVSLCEEVLAQHPDASEATALFQRARAAIDASARDRAKQLERALDSTNAFLLAGRLDDAERELDRAKGFGPASPALQALEESLRAARLDAERTTERDRLGAQVIAAARATFAQGAREQALGDLRAFLTREPQATAVSAELASLTAELTRRHALERQAAAVAAYVRSAEAALEADDPDEASKFAEQALGLNPQDEPARKIQRLTAARLREREEGRKREATAARNIIEARQLLGRGKFQKARELASAAAMLNPGSAEPAAMLAAIIVGEAAAAAAAERDRIARQRAKAAAPALEQARAAEAQSDWVRAGYMAENALALDLESTEARGILERVRSKLTEQPSLADDTVGVGDSQAGGNSEDTVTIAGQPTGWRRVTAVIKNWSRPGASSQAKPVAPGAQRTKQ
jgi:tetratricopeptide (TPR) repeat protein